MLRSCTKYSPSSELARDFGYRRCCVKFRRRSFRSGKLPFTHDHCSRPICRTFLPSAERSGLVDPAGDRRLFLEPVHILRNVHRSAKALPSPRRGGNVRKHPALRRTIWRRPQARFPGRWRCDDAVHPSPRGRARRDPPRPARRTEGVELLPAAQFAEEIGGGASRVGGPWSVARLCGAESGDDEVLARVNKGETFETTREALEKLQEAGIKRSVMILNGLGGQELSRQHALNSAALMNAAQPEFLATLVVSFPNGETRLRGNFPSWEPLSVPGLMQEMELFLSALGAEADRVPQRPRFELAGPERNDGRGKAAAAAGIARRHSRARRRPIAAGLGARPIASAKVSCSGDLAVRNRSV